MKESEIELMARVEDAHWWYRGLRDALRRLLSRPRFALPRGAAVLDAGCGTGGNLLWLREALAPGYLGGFDASELCASLARRKVPEADVYVSDLCAPEIHHDALDLILSADVVCNTGAARARPGLAALVSRLRAGGRLVLHLPAYPWLYSEHDVAVGGSERFTARSLRALLSELDLDVELVTYRMCLLLPVVVLARAPSVLKTRLGRQPEPAAARSDVKLPGRLANALLTGALRAENAALAGGLRLPWGSSILAVGKKRGAVPLHGSLRSRIA